ncbi:MAG: hypothetical protein JWP81_1544 [Ferruginibacter sp.]|nr:hypothetical protein [Ferruginibacter sp.]
MDKSFKLQDIKQYEIVFICGLYKTGTSLLTQLIETDLRYFNPSASTNPNERGYGRKKERYHTRECKQLRSLNLGFINSSKIDERSIFNYLDTLQKPSVLKDPQFCFTLCDWYEKAIAMNFNPLIIFTNRELVEIKESWSFAPYTKGLLENGKLDLFLAAYNEQIMVAKEKKLSHISIEFNEILNLSPELK